MLHDRDGRDPTGSKPPSVSVAICGFSQERWPLLVKAMDSIADQSRPPDQVLLVIDHNRELLSRCRQRWPEAGVVASSGEPGLSGARNTAVALCQTDLIAFLDDDAFAAPDWLATLVEAYGDPSVVAAGGVVLPQWCGGRPPWFPPEFDWVVGCSHAGMPVEKTSVRNVIGANMSFRCDLLRIGGAFRAELGRLGTRPLGCEETEACIRVRRQSPGGKVMYEPAARVFHSVPVGRSSVSYFFSRCAAEGRSKAVVSSFVGPEEGLAAERSYVWRTIAPAFARSLISVGRGDAYGLQRAAVMTAGVVVTATAYGWMRLAGAVRRPPLGARSAPDLVNEPDA